MSAGPEEQKTQQPTRSRPFRKPFSTERLAPDRVERQSKVTRLAFEVLGLEGAREFLNAQDDDLGGRPLDLAMASDDGLRVIQTAILARSSV